MAHSDCVQRNKGAHDYQTEVPAMRRNPYSTPHSAYWWNAKQVCSFGYARKVVEQSCIQLTRTNTWGSFTGLPCSTWTANNDTEYSG